MSQKDRDRLVVLRQVAQQDLTVSAGARRLRMSVRQMRRLLRRFEREGDGMVVHGLRGRPSNHHWARALREQARARAGAALP